MYFLTGDDDFQENIALFGIKSALKELVCNKNSLETNIKSHSDKVTDFYDKKISRLDFDHTCFEVISLNSAFKKDDNYYQQ